MEQRLFALEETVRCLMRVIGEDKVRASSGADVSVRGSAKPSPEPIPVKARSDSTGSGALPSLDPVLVHLLLLARSLRHKHLGPDFDQDPAWTMLLELARAELQGTDMSITSLCIGSGAPDTTALRYIKILEDDGYLARRPDKRDGRRSFIHLTPAGRKALSRMLEELRTKASRLIADFV